MKIWILFRILVSSVAFEIGSGSDCFFLFSFPFQFDFKMIVNWYEYKYKTNNRSNTHTHTQITLNCGWISPTIYFIGILWKFNGITRPLEQIWNNCDRFSDYYYWTRDLCVGSYFFSPNFVSFHLSVWGWGFFFHLPL